MGVKKISKIVIEVYKNKKLLNKVFNDTSLGLKIFKVYYNNKMKLLFSIIKKRLGSWIVIEKSDYIKAEETGNKQYIEQQYIKFTNFMFNKEKELKDNDTYKKLKSDRIFIRIVQRIRMVGKVIKDKALNKALGGNRVIDFFNKSGLIIVWKKYV